MLKINSYTDESGQDTHGKFFVTCTVCVASQDVEDVEKKLLKIEGSSEKTKKWYNSGNKKRHKYIQLLLDEKIFEEITVYYSFYQNKTEYSQLLGTHIAKAILAFASGESYISKIFIDKMNKKTLEEIKKKVKSFHIKYKKIRGLSEESSAYIRLVDALCGAIRDLNNKSVAKSYRTIFNKLIEV